jgi:NADH-quinone oxidoreductase subunit L
MTAPLVVLAFAAVFAGFLGFPPEKGWFQDLIEPVFSHETATAGQSEEAALYVVNDAGAAVTANGQEEDSTTADEAVETEEHHISSTTTWTFGIISTIVAVSGIWLAYSFYISGRFSPARLAEEHQGLYRFLYNRWGIDDLYDRVFVKPASALAMFLWSFIDVRVIDGTVNEVARDTLTISQRLRRVQTGLVSNYALAIALGTVVIVGVYLVGFSSLNVPWIS